MARFIGSALVVLLSRQLAAAQDPWVEQSKPANDAPGGTTYEALALPAATTIWGWTSENHFRGFIDYRVVVSMDEGQTWQTQLVASRTPVSGAGYTGQDVIDACTTDGQHTWVLTRDASNGKLQLLYAPDAKTFSALPQPPQRSGQLVFFDNTTGLYLARSASNQQNWPLYRTTDGGTTWAAVSNSPGPLPDERLAGVTTLGNATWLATTKGRVLSTLDAGLSWQVAVLPIDGAASKLAFVSPTRGLAVTPTGVLASTADAGKTWTLQATTGPIRSEGIIAVPTTSGTYVTFDGLCLGSSCPIRGSAITVDGGVTWRELENTIYHTTMAASSPTRLWSSSYHSATLLKASNLVLSTSPRFAEGPFIFPNPSRGVLHIAAQAYARQVRLVDMMGRLCGTYQVPPQGTVLTITGHQAGLYLLQCWRGRHLEAQQRILLQP